MIKGSITALITPFAGGKVDKDAFEKLVDWQIAAGTHGLVPCGTTGESPTLSHQEHMEVVELCIGAAAGRVPVIAGAGSNSTAEAVMLARHAQKAGADAVLVVTPYYNKPVQEGLFRHFEAVHDAIDIPVIVYNIPGRSVIDIGLDTMVRLAALPRVIGVKDATADLSRVSAYRQAIGLDFIQLSGEDATALAHMAAGGHGCISVTANIAPKLCADFQNASMAGDFAAALDIQDRLYPLHKNLFVESNPAPVKFVAAQLGLCAEELRLPLVPVNEASRAILRRAMIEAGLSDDT
jgi:4-hydroxy-tetrahydrodipicolinate synthase